MDRKLLDVFQRKEDNYILPFFWQHEGNSENLEEQIRRIYESGCRALCVESRPYEGFCGPDWWADMGRILAEAKRRGMKVWILDDKHFPTGFANGLLEKRYQHLHRWFLREHHVDLLGPKRDSSLIVPRCDGEEELLAVCAYRRTGEGEEMAGEPVIFPVSTDDRFLYWDVPEGCWRVFFIYKTCRGSNEGHEWYINMLSRDSVHVLIEAVYEPHYQHLSEYFGNTLVGFFSDEPSFDCQHIGPWGQDAGFYYRTVGQPGVALPWDDMVESSMHRDGVATPLAALPGLWYSIRGQSPSIRLAFMDAVTQLWKENFSHQLGDWCRAHGVQYIGHIIEDMNAHARLGCSGGHYFRSLDGQDMSGIDIVLHQVMPGMADFQTAANIANGVADPGFFHYVLAQLGASQARLTPQMKGRAMCEVFGAFGWAEGTPFMKWLIDFLLVRGITHFVPHAFTDVYPDPDCPPHFYANGNDPQFTGFSMLMGYTNRMSHLLYGAERETAGAVLYHAEAEWMDGTHCMLTEKPAEALYNACIDYDIVPIDALETATVRDRKLILNGHAHNFLVISQASFLPETFWRAVCRLKDVGVPVFFLEDAPAFNGPLPGEVLPLSQLVSTVLERELAHNYTNSAHLLRLAQFQRENASYFMLFNESTVSEARTEILLPKKGAYLQMDILNGIYERGFTSDGNVSISLAPYQSEILLFDQFDDAFLSRFPEGFEWKCEEQLELRWEITLLESGKDEDYRPLRDDSGLFNITGCEGEMEFSGLIRYRTRFMLEESVPLRLDLGAVGDTAKITLNGHELGMRICSPYRWEISDAAVKGVNTLEVTVTNTLVHRIQDRFSQYMQIPPSGLMGPVTVWR